MRLRYSNNIPLNYIFSYILTVIYKISLNDEQHLNRNVVTISEWKKYNGNNNKMTFYQN